MVNVNASEEANRTIVTGTYPPFSVAISVYKKDNPKWFDMALSSIINQTVKPSEIVLVVDGPVPDGISHIIDKYIEICKLDRIQLKVIKLADNKGLGEALKIAVEQCCNELIARMDSDDIAVASRFEAQLKRFRDNDIDICGGQIEEFIDDPSNILGKRIVPETDHALKEYMKKRCPFNHVTVMYKKSAVLDAGNYRDWFWNEDYYLWIRMSLQNQKFANLPITLVYVRVGTDMYKRRGGMRYFRSEAKLQKYMLQKKVINLPTYTVNVIKRLILQLLLPNRIRGWVFQKFARD